MNEALAAGEKILTFVSPILTGVAYVRTDNKINDYKKESDGKIEESNRWMITHIKQISTEMVSIKTQLSTLQKENEILRRKMKVLVSGNFTEPRPKPKKIGEKRKVSFEEEFQPPEEKKKSISKLEEDDDLIISEVTDSEEEKEEVEEEDDDEDEALRIVSSYPKAKN